MCYSCLWLGHSVYVMLSFPDSQNVEFICNVLVVADQLLISRLKEICEVAIAERREFFHLYYKELENKKCLFSIFLGCF